MANKRSTLALVLESYLNACLTMASFRDERGDALKAYTSALIKNSYSIQLGMFRNILMAAELTPDEIAEVELALKRVEKEYTNEEVLESAQMIRAKIQRARPSVVVLEGRNTPCLDLDRLADQQDYPD